jgi:hypothetical protein
MIYAVTAAASERLDSMFLQQSDAIGEAAVYRDGFIVDYDLFGFSAMAHVLFTRLNGIRTPEEIRPVPSW